MGYSLNFMRIEGGEHVDADRHELAAFLAARGLHVVPDESTGALFDAGGQPLAFDGNWSDLYLDPPEQEAPLAGGIFHATLSEAELGFIFELCVAAGFLIVNPQGSPTYIVPAENHPPQALDDPEDTAWVGNAAELRQALSGSFSDFVRFRDLVLSRPVSETLAARERSRQRAEQPSPRELATLSLLAQQYREHPADSAAFHGYWARAMVRGTWVVALDPSTSRLEISEDDGVPTLFAFTTSRRASLGTPGPAPRFVTATLQQVADEIDHGGVLRVVLDRGLDDASLDAAWLRGLVETYAEQPHLSTRPVVLPRAAEGTVADKLRTTQQEILQLVAAGLDLEETETASRFTVLGNHARVGHPIAVILGLGADPERTDSKGYRPLHHAANGLHVENVRLLLRAGAEVSAQRVLPGARTGSAGTGTSQAPTPLLPLELAASRGVVGDGLDDLLTLTQLVELLVAAGSPVTDAVRADITLAARSGEARRILLSEEDAATQDAALARLSELTGAQPAERITAPSASLARAIGDTDAERFANLRGQLVPEVGRATTVQGEVVRIVDVILAEIRGNDGLDFTEAHVDLARAWHGYLETGLDNGISGPGWDCVLEIQEHLATRRGFEDASWDELMRSVAVTWVAQNPQLIPLGDVAYRL
ncbi:MULTISPECIES: hypothetical protein [unclassified Pseudoclavibacter]|uniref:hypothetical protein n=1 Tax=unclassified Pseudoclavibacter TaxID=2615177 RepID=UPI001C639916|nr:MULTISPECIES: hypothetical protein [unclassified Pseudoclavibacter]